MVDRSTSFILPGPSQDNLHHYNTPASMCFENFGGDARSPVCIPCLWLWSSWSCYPTLSPPIHFIIARNQRGVKFASTSPI